MDVCEYKEVCSENGSNDKSWKPLLKQLLICSGIWSSVFLYGLCVAAPTVFIPQLRKELAIANSTNGITDEMASWITSMYSFSGFFYVLILTISTRYFGRKKPFIITIVNTFISLLILYFSKNITHILISEIMLGMFSALQIVLVIIIVTEYISPKYRGIFLWIKSATFYCGIWTSNAIGTFLNWKVIPLLGIGLTVYIFLLVIFWPESPYWLASRGRFEECAISHRWLKGIDVDSEKELEDLINNQKAYDIARHRDVKMTLKDYIIDFLKTVSAKEFYKPTLLSFTTGVLGVFTGKLICALYALDILKKITQSESTAYVGMLVLDAITVTSMYLGCTLTKFVNRRPLLLVASSIGVLFLFILSLYLYLIKLGVMFENKYVSILLLSAFSIAISCGPLVMSISVYAELIPIRSRNLSVCIIALLGKLIVFVSLKTAPLLFKSFGMHGVFLTFGVSSSLVICILYKYLPETKDKTLQEISDSMIDNKLKSEGADKLLSKEEKVI